MRRRTLLVLLSLLLTSCTIPTTPQVYKRVHHILSQEGPHIYEGSCFATSSVHVVTAKHVVNPKRTWIMVDARTYSIKSIEEFGEDGVRICIGSHGLTPIPVGRLGRRGEQLRALGFPGGLDVLAVTRGESMCAGYMSAPVTFGMSGGPVINAQDEVVGVTSAFNPRAGFTVFDILEGDIWNQK